MIDNIHKFDKTGLTAITDTIPDGKAKNEIKGRFKLGVSGNPKGRPRGAFSQRTYRTIELYDVASTYFLRVLELLIGHIEAGEQWAFQLFLVKFCKEYEGTISIGDISASNTTTMIQALLDKLPEFGEFTKKDAMDCLKALSIIKSTEVTESMEGTNRVSHEALVDRLAVLNKAIELKDKSDIM